jgi:multidrug efflux pump subunit AcrA (membrane-fusion protein)
MKANLKTLASLALALTVTAVNAQTAATSSTSTSTPKKKVHHKAEPAGPSVQSQIDSLRSDMQSQIQNLKQQLSEKDAQLQQAQQAAAAAQAAAQQAQQAANAAQQANTENATAVTSLQGAVTDLKTNNASLVQTVQDAQKQETAAIEHPDSIHYKGITLGLNGSFLAGETVYRNHATGADIPTPFSAIPLNASDYAQLSEFYGSGRQSRIALLAEGKAKDFTMRGYYEADFLGVGTTSNNNESNSYVLRQRQLWAQAQRAKWTITGGQMWSLVTETRQGMTNRTEATPLTIDPNYVPGFSWERQYGFRVVNEVVPQRLWVGVSAENPETLNLGGTVPANLLLGSYGSNGGAYNGGGTYTISGNVPAVGAAANYSFNLAPDIIAKIAYEPKFGGHFEAYGLARFLQYRNYVGYKSTSTFNPTTGVTSVTITYTSAYNDQTVGGGVGGSFRYPVLNKKVELGLKGLWGDGVSRYGDSTLSDATADYNGRLKLLHGYSGLATVEAHATPRLDVYLNWGTDGVFRNYSTSPTGGQFGYGNYHFSNTGCDTQPAPVSAYAPNNPGSCAANTRDVQEFVIGYWYDFYKGPMGRLRQGFQYSYATRNVFSGITGATPQGTDGMFWTSFRYYLP